MIDESLYRRLVPGAPLHRRTERDPLGSVARTRLQALRTSTPPTPGLQTPRLNSSWEGRIERILFAFPAFGVADEQTSAGYRSVISALRRGTEFVVVHPAAARDTVEEWFRAAGHGGATTLVPLPDFVSFTDWAEDAYLALTDAADGSTYLMEPWRFQRAGDALIADAVEEFTDIRAAQAPLIFQGGNVLVGDEFWFLGTDYFADSLTLLQGARPPVTFPADADLDAAVRHLFGKYADAGRELTLIGTRRPLTVPEFRGRREDGAFFLDLPAGGAGAFQPIFHIDMFITLIGRRDGRFVVLVGDPSLGEELTGRRSPYDLRDAYDEIATTLRTAGFDVRRNPLVHQGTPGRRLTLADLRALGDQQGNSAMVQAVAELAAAGAEAATQVTVRDWHHVTWNNCLVESSGSVGRHVYVPTYGHGEDADLAVVDRHMARLWADLGFEVHELGDFRSFARRQGVVHCIKKYLRRGD